MIKLKKWSKFGPIQALAHKNHNKEKIYMLVHVLEQTACCGKIFYVTPVHTVFPQYQHLSVWTLKSLMLLTYLLTYLLNFSNIMCDFNSNRIYCFKCNSSNSMTN